MIQIEIFGGIYLKNQNVCRGLGGVSQASCSQEPTLHEARSYLPIQLYGHSITSFHIFIFIF